MFYFNMEPQLTWNKIIFGTSEAPWPWPWIWSYGIQSCITHRPPTTYQISLKLEKFLYGRTDVRMVCDVCTYWRTDISPLMLLGRLGGVGLLIYQAYRLTVLLTKYTLSQKSVPPITCYNLDMHDAITIICGRHVTKKVRNQIMLCFPTSPI